MTKYRLEMTEEQAKTLVNFLDLAIRIRMGQWGEIVEQCMKFDRGDVEGWCKRRDEAEALLLRARDIVMPELADMHSLSGGHGVYAQEVTERAYNVLLAVRSCIAYHKKPEGGYTVNFNKPMAIYIAKEYHDSCRRYQLSDEYLQEQKFKTRAEIPTAVELYYGVVFLQDAAVDALIKRIEEMEGQYGHKGTD